MSDDDFICLMMKKYVIGSEMDFFDAACIMADRGMTTEEMSELVKRTERGKKWPKFVISVVKSSNAVLA